MGACFVCALRRARAGKKPERAASVKEIGRTIHFCGRDFPTLPGRPLKRRRRFHSEKLIINFVKPLFSTIFELNPLSEVIFCE
jgi:hypothetical protein